MVYLFVGIGGVIGSVLRHFLGSMAVEIWGKGFPLGTLFINLSGAFFLGYVTSRLRNLKKWHPHLFTGVSTGIIGSFTTFSTLSVEAVKLLETEEYAKACLYILSSLIGGLLMVRLGYNWGKQQVTKAGGQL